MTLQPGSRRRLLQLDTAEEIAERERQRPPAGPVRFEVDCFGCNGVGGVDLRTTPQGVLGRTCQVCEGTGVQHVELDGPLPQLVEVPHTCSKCGGCGMGRPAGAQRYKLCDRCGGCGIGTGPTRFVVRRRDGSAVSFPPTQYREAQALLAYEQWRTEGSTP